MGIAIAPDRAAQKPEMRDLERSGTEPELRRLLLICEVPPAKEMVAQFVSRGVDIDVVADGIGAVKRLWEQRYDAILAEASCARVGGHRLGDVVAEIAPGTAVVVLKEGQRIFPDEAGASPFAEAGAATAGATVVGELIVAVTLAVRRRAARRK